MGYLKPWSSPLSSSPYSRFSAPTFVVNPSASLHFLLYHLSNWAFILLILAHI